MQFENFNQFKFLDDMEIERSHPKDDDLVLEMKEELEIEAKGRNSRKPKKANHGARPCSSFMRKLKKSGLFSKMNKND